MRLRFMLFLYNDSSVLYTELFKRNRKAWGLSVSDFLAYPTNTLGYALGNFYLSNGFDIMPKLENHDVFHVITETNTDIQGEIAMQYLLMGNGKRSLYMYAMIGVGTVIYPEFIRYYMFSYQKGKSLSKFHHIEFKDYLAKPLVDLQHSLYLKSKIQSI